MRIAIKSLLSGARSARGAVVIIDVFRTSSLIVSLLAHGVKQIIPTLTPEGAQKLKNENSVLLGERLGRKLQHFDYNISPVQLARVALSNKKIVLTTTNGTRGLLNAQHADEILIGSFLNAETLAQYLKKKELVTLVPIGMMYGKMKAIEDELCAELIRDYILGKEIDFGLVRRKIKNSSFF